MEIASWHWVFLVNVPVGALGWIAARRYLPDFRGVERNRLDVPGYGLLALGMALVLLSVDGLSALGLHGATSLVVLVTGLACLAAYWLRAGRQAHPLFPPSLFRVPALSIGLTGNLISRLGSSAVPFLIPLMLQLSLGYSPAQAGMMMLPMALAGMLIKRFATWSITRYGYRRVLVINTACVGGMIASFALISGTEPVWLLVLQFYLFGSCNSLQFTAMNTLTLRDLDTAQASSGNSLLSMVQMLAMSLGVALAAAVLGGFAETLQAEADPARMQQAFRYTFICMGGMTLASAWVFWQLSPHSVWVRRLEEDPGFD